MIFSRINYKHLHYHNFSIKVLGFQLTLNFFYYAITVLGSTLVVQLWEAFQRMHNITSITTSDKVNHQNVLSVQQVSAMCSSDTDSEVHDDDMSFPLESPSSPVNALPTGPAAVSEETSASSKEKRYTPRTSARRQVHSSRK